MLDQVDSLPDPYLNSLLLFASAAIIFSLCASFAACKLLNKTSTPTFEKFIQATPVQMWVEKTSLNRRTRRSKKKKFKNQSKKLPSTSVDSDENSETASDKIAWEQMNIDETTDEIFV